MASTKKPSFKGGTFVRSVHLDRLDEIGVVMRETPKGVRVHFADGIGLVPPSLLRPTKRTIDLPKAAWIKIRDDAIAEHTEFLQDLFPALKEDAKQFNPDQITVRLAAARGQLDRIPGALLIPENFLDRKQDGSFVARSEPEGPIQNAATNGQLHFLPPEARTARAMLDCGHPDWNKPGNNKPRKLEENQKFDLGDGYTLTFFPGSYDKDHTAMIGDLTSPTEKVGHITVVGRPGNYMVVSARSDEFGKGLYRRSLKAMADHLGSIHSDPDLNTTMAATAAWEAVGARKTPTGQYILSREQPENIHAFGNAFHAAIVAGKLRDVRLQPDMIAIANEIEPSVDRAIATLYGMSNVVRSKPDEGTEFDDRARYAEEWIESLRYCQDESKEQAGKTALPDIPSVPKNLPAVGAGGDHAREGK